MRNIYLVLGLAVLLNSCTKKDVGSGEGPDKDSLALTSYIDVSYGIDPKQKLDVYLPANRNASTKTLIIIHGGGWSSGDKSDFNNYITEFQKRLPGYAFANLNYRLASKTANHFPTQEMDIKAAMTFLKDQTSEYNVSGDFILLGISAGAHLAMLQGYKHTEIVQPHAIISFFGPVDMSKLYYDGNGVVSEDIIELMNARLEENLDLFKNSSPITFVNSNSAPTLMLHGDQDNLVPLEQPYALRDKLTEFGVTNKLVIYPGQGHGWIGADLEDSFLQVQSFLNGLEN